MGNLTKLSLDEIVATLQVLESVGDVGKTQFDRLRSDKMFASRIAYELMRGGGDWRDRDRKLLPPNYTLMPVFGGEEWEHFFRVELTPEQWEVANHFPWPDSVITEGGPGVDSEVRSTHFAFLGLEGVNERDDYREPPERYGRFDLPIDVEHLDYLVERLAYWNKPRHQFPSYSIGGNRLDWYEEELFRCRPARTRWYLIPIQPATRNMARRVAYEPMSAVEYLLGHILHYQKYGRWLSTWRAECPETMKAITDDVAVTSVPDKNWGKVIAGFHHEYNHRQLVVQPQRWRSGQQNPHDGFAVTRRLPE